MTDKLIRMIMMIAERYSRHSKFIGYTYREDMVSSAVINLCNNALKFDPKRYATPNPFAYYTTSIRNSFLQYMADEKKHRNIRDALLVDAGANPSWNFNPDQAAPDVADVETKTSDDVEITDADHHEQPADQQPAPNVEEKKPPRSRHPKWAAREPGPVTRINPADCEWVDGKLIIKTKPELPPKVEEMKVVVRNKKVTIKKPPRTKQLKKRKA